MKTFEEINKEEFLEWYNLEVTQAIFRHLRETKESLTEDLAGGATLGDAAEQRTARAVGMIEGLSYLLNIRYEVEDA